MVRDNKKIMLGGLLVFRNPETHIDQMEEVVDQIITEEPGLLEVNLLMGEVLEL